MGAKNTKQINKKEKIKEIKEIKENEIICCVNANTKIACESQKDYIANYIINTIKNTGHCNKFLTACYKAHENAEFKQYFPNQKFVFRIKIETIDNYRFKVELYCDTLVSHSKNFLDTDFGKYLNTLAIWSGYYLNKENIITVDDKFNYNFKLTDYAKVFYGNPEDAYNAFFNYTYLTFCIDDDNVITNLQPEVRYV